MKNHTGKGEGSVNIGKQILSIRKEKQLTQEEFGRLFHVTRQTVSNWENEKSYPDLQMLVDIDVYKRQPYVVQEQYPQVTGVLVAAKGGDNPVVVQNIREAVEALFQVEPHKIKVMKMN